jgi:hypothetical protein
VAVEVKEPIHDTRDIWAAALKAAAGVARQAASSEEDLLHAVSSELRRLDMRGTVALLDHDGQLVLQSRALMKVMGSQPVVIAPLLLEDRPVGTINVTASWLTPDDIPMVETLADHVAIALGHVRTRTQMHEALEREKLRNQVIEAVASSLDLSDVLKRVLDLAVEVVQADAGAIGLRIYAERRGAGLAAHRNQKADSASRVFPPSERPSRMG